MGKLGVVVVVVLMILVCGCVEIRGMTKSIKTIIQSANLHANKRGSSHSF